MNKSSLECSIRSLNLHTYTLFFSIPPPTHPPLPRPIVDCVKCPRAILFGPRPRARRFEDLGSFRILCRGTRRHNSWNRLFTLLPVKQVRKLTIRFPAVLYCRSFDAGPLRETDSQNIPRSLPTVHIGYGYSSTDLVLAYASSDRYSPQLNWFGTRGFAQGGSSFVSRFRRTWRRTNIFSMPSLNGRTLLEVQAVRPRIHLQHSGSVYTLA